MNSIKHFYNNLKTIDNLHSKRSVITGILIPDTFYDTMTRWVFYYRNKTNVG